MKISTFDTLVQQSLELEQEQKLTEALQTAKKALSIGMAEKVSRLERWKLLIVLARLASKLKDNGQIRFLESILIHKPTSRQEASVFAKAMIMQAGYYLTKEEGSKAVKIYVQTEEFIHFWNLEDKDYLLTFVYKGLAEYYAEQTNPEAVNKAVEYALTSLSIKRRNNLNRTDMLLLLSSLHDELAMPAESEKYLNELQEILQDKPEAVLTKSSYLTVKSRVELRKGNVFTALQDCINALQLALQQSSVNIVRNILNLQNTFLVVQSYDLVYECGELVESYVRCDSSIPKELHVYSLIRSCEAALFQSRSDIGRHYLQRVDALCAEYQTHKSTILNVWQFKFRYAVQTRDMLMATTAFAEIEAHIVNFHDTRKKNIFLICSKLQCLHNNTTEAKELLEKSKEISLQSENIIDNLHCTELEMQIYQEIGMTLELEVARKKYQECSKIFMFSDAEKEQAQTMTKYVLLDTYREVHKYVQKHLLDMEVSMTTLQKNIIRERDTSKIEVHNFAKLKNNVQIYIKQLSEITSNKVYINTVVSTLESMLELFPKENGNRRQEFPAEQAYVVHCTPEMRMKLQRIAPTLNNKEIDYCYLLLQGWDKKEICGAIDLEYKSLAKFRYRLARKLGLPKNAKIHAFMLQIE